VGEVVAGGRKLVGSAQLRRGGAALQHGTLRLRVDAGHAAPFLRATGVPATAVASLDQVCARPVSFEEVTEALTAGFGVTFNATLTAAPCDEALRMRAQELERAKYRAESWTAAR